MSSLASAGGWIMGSFGHQHGENNVFTSHAGCCTSPALQCHGLSVGLG
jgi:hypothetical protein